MAKESPTIIPENITRDTTNEQAIIIAQMIANMNYFNKQLEDILEVVAALQKTVETLKSRESNSFSSSLDQVLKTMGNFTNGKPKKMIDRGFNKEKLKNELDLLLAKLAYDDSIDLDEETNRLYDKIYGEI